MLKVTYQITINISIQKVWDILTNTRLIKEWDDFLENDSGGI